MLNLIVIRSRNIGLSRAFYEAIGLVFTDEKHGSGPEHIASQLPNGVVFEIYPQHLSGEIWSGRGTAETILGFETDCNLNNLFDRQRDLFVEIDPPKNGKTRVIDYDGHIVLLTEKSR